MVARNEGWMVQQGALTLLQMSKHLLDICSGLCDVEGRSAQDALEASTGEARHSSIQVRLQLPRRGTINAADSNPTHNLLRETERTT